MSETITVTVLKQSAIPALNNWKKGEQELEQCYECGGKVFYIANTNALLYGPELAFKVVGRSTDWEHYNIEKGYTNNHCAICGTSQGGWGTWQHTIFELDNAELAEDYKEALAFLQTGTLPAGHYNTNALLRLAEEIKDKTAKYWTRHNITEAIQHEQLEAKKKGLMQVKDERDQDKTGNTPKIEKFTPN